MTGFARDRCVAAAQGIPGIPVMVERRILPVRLAVARPAGGAEAATVNIFLRMAPAAIPGGLVHVQAAGMAGVAFDCRMRFAQSESGIALVVELERLP